VFLGLAVGVLAGWISLVTVDGPAALATVSARFFLILLLLLPIGLLAQVYLASRNQREANEQSLSQTLAELLVAALLGSLGGSLFFVGAAGQIPAVFSGESAADIIILLYPEIGWGRFLAVCLATIAVAIVAAIWVNRHV